MKWISALTVAPSGQMVHGTQITKDHLAGYPSPLVSETGTDPSSSGRDHICEEKPELLAAEALPVLWQQM